jgi:hypothetical protein
MKRIVVCTRMTAALAVAASSSSLRHLRGDAAIDHGQ